jgi:aspartate aminotransferase-like enzyme
MQLVSDFCKRNHILLIVDAISAFISDELDMTALGAAAVITGSQKALAVQPGVALTVLAPEAIARIKQNDEVCMYLSMKEALGNGERGQTPFTPAVTTLLQIHTRLREIQDRGGIDVERKRIAETARYFRDGIREYPLYPVSESPSNTVTSLHPHNTGAGKIVSALKDEYGIWVCPNGGAMADRVFRVGHIGNITKENNDTLLEAFGDMNRRGLL